ncbi:nuclease-related domain-containing protein [Ornithinibacillus contaminans]|uniref:nuclease-related domain-containing protein n=1 Tax=Ornithinibacillus contaminans TaxID=694055 RepID=UPI00064D870C|nr:nuclease-related domain-containing protein [Ornithinibacillus contaminans]
MILKERGESLELLQLEALHSRIPSNHRKKEAIQTDLIKLKRGIKGEKEIDYPLTFLDESYSILHNVRISDDNGYFQLDTLIITTYYILILEVKNWYGTIVFGQNGQVTRIDDDSREEGFPNPVPQVKLQRFRLQRWLLKHNYQNIPIKFLVVISSPSTIIKSLSPNHTIPGEVVHNNDLFFQIREIEKTAAINKRDTNRLCKHLVSVHTPSSINLLDKYELTKDDLIKGVICERCSDLPMIRQRKRWWCPNCGHESLHAHVKTLHDYRVLFGSIISNREARAFLHVDSPYVVKHLLQKEKYKYVGNTSSRKYFLE